MKYYKLIYIVLIGILIIFFNFYLRIFRSRDLLLLSTWKKNLTIISFTLIIIFFVFHFIIIISILYFLYNRKYKIERQSKLVNCINYIINKIYWEPLEYIYNYLAPKIPGSAKFFLFLDSLLEKGNRKLRYKIYHNSYILFSFFPQIMCAMTFLIEIVFFHKLHIFFYMIIFLLIPIIYNIFIKLLETFFINNFENFNEYLQIYGSDITESGIYEKFHFSFKPEYSQNSKEVLDELTEGWIILKRINFHIETIKKHKGYYSPYILLFSSFLYFISSFYRILYVLY